MSGIFDNALRMINQAVDNFANSSDGIEYYQKEQQDEKMPEHIPLWYAEKEDNYLATVLDNKLTRMCLESMVDKYYLAQTEEILKNSSKLTKGSFPAAFSVLNHCSEVLKIDRLPIVCITNKIKGINALSVEAAGKQMILMSFNSVAMLSAEEMAFLLGHELSHHQQGNLICHTVNGLMNSMVKSSDIFGPLLLDAIEVPLKRWCRQSEFNADRAGYLCCPNIQVIKNLFLKLGMIENANAYHLYKETGEDHPMLSTRYQRLVDYSKINEKMI